ncbi:hypothetical protein Cgig2_019035 [Carnegiea gigantea]|uniref:Subtilisin-like protease n=1 Tax=Carnegiea gigantea TaxID=171969 RepID=A0A9Q1GI05_9CARY|nr:hypothetical protein Cgig2_019035 [Carnegiea gigantea]
MDKTLMPTVFTSHHHWYNSIVDSLSSISTPTASFIDPKSMPPSSPQVLYSYDKALHGFSALLSPDELQSLEKHPACVTAYKETKGTIHTTRSIDFLSLNPHTGLWPASGYGENVIIGVIDSGVWPESRSFRDDGMPPVPSKWKGGCESGQDFNTSMCNKKLIGARCFNKGFKAAHPKVKLKMNSARDTEGHGTHTASTVAGAFVDGVSFFGYAPGTARGVAPRARVAVYKALWEYGVYSSDILAAIDQAISDGVDVISVSLDIGGVPLYKDPVAIGSFAAMEHGVLLSSSAGNAGPLLGTLHNGIPWALTVAAGTIDRQFSGMLSLGNGHTILGWSLFPASALVEKVSLKFDEKLSACNSSTLLSKAGPNEIIICADMGTTLYQMGTIVGLKVAAAIFISDYPVANNLLGGVPFPGIVINSKEGRSVVKYAKTTKRPWASMRFQQTSVGSTTAPAAALYTSRGPSPSYSGILKPDLMAPGSQILAAFVPSTVAATIGNNIILSSEYALLSGTSMACPHASGVAALLKAAHPTWSPTAIKSAMMTTANPLDNSGNPIKEEGEATKPASPLAMGSGQIDPNRALDPGLVYDATPQDYVNLLCSMNITKSQMLTITKSSKYHCLNTSSDLNYPSFIALYDNETKTRVKTFQRTVTNVGPEGVATTTYKASMIAPVGTRVTVNPQILVFKKQYEKQSYRLTIKYGRNHKGKA